MQKKPMMSHFIEEQRARGRSEKEIQSQLLEAGWQMDIIMHAMNTNMHTYQDNQVKPLRQGMINEPIRLVLRDISKRARRMRRPKKDEKA